MIRARFVVPDEDPRPIHWPIKHPYWVTGEGERGAVLVAYATDMNELMYLWPDALDVEYTEETKYLFTSRFTRPEWFTLQQCS